MNLAQILRKVGLKLCAYHCQNCRRVQTRATVGWMDWQRQWLPAPAPEPLQPRTARLPPPALYFSLRPLLCAELASGPVQSRQVWLGQGGLQERVGAGIPSPGSTPPAAHQEHQFQRVSETWPYLAPTPGTDTSKKLAVRTKSGFFFFSTPVRLVVNSSNFFPPTTHKNTAI